MFFRLSHNSFVRQYGKYTYLYNHYENSDKVYVNTDFFSKFLTRDIQDFNITKNKIIRYYSDASPEEVAQDFCFFIDELINQKFLVAGMSIEELEQKDNISFSYKDSFAKTSYDTVSVEERFEEISQTVLGDFFRENPTLFNLQIDITQSCTERCIHCYIPEYNRIFLPLEKIADVIREFRSMGGLHVSLSGGECMLHPEFEKILSYIHDFDCTISVLSNLTLCNDSIVELLRKLDASVQVSLYSMDAHIHDFVTQMPGSWKKTKTAIEKLYKADVPVLISCPTMKCNFNGYADVMAFAESMNMRSQTDFIMMAQADHCTDNLKNRLSLEQVEELLRDIITKDIPYMKEHFDPQYKDELDPPEKRAEQPLCGAGTDSICLNANGNYYACSGFQDFSLGNCYEQSLHDVWFHSPKIQYLRSLRGRDIPQCIHCEDRNYCSMCLVRNFNETGDMLTVAKHFCNVAALNHKIVDEYQALLMNGKK